MGLNPYLKKLGFGVTDRVVLINADDIGMCQATLPAFLDLADGGLITGASVMGAVFAVQGLRFTFAVAGLLASVALVMRRPSPDDFSKCATGSNPPNPLDSIPA